MNISLRTSGEHGGATFFRKFWHLLTARQKRSAIALLGIMLLGMILETFGVAFVMPAIGVMVSEDLPRSYPALAPWLALLGHPTQQELVVGGMLVFVAIIASKAIVLGFLAWKQARFSFGLQAALSERLFAGYLRQPWTFHLQRNSAQLIRNATREVAMCTDVSLGMLALLTECLVVLGISVLLVVVEPVGALVVVATLGIAAWTLHRATRRKLLAWGKARQHHEGMRIQHLQQGLGGAKDVKLLGREAEFIQQYSVHNNGTARVSEYVSTVQQFPRLWLELLAAVGLACLVIVMIAQGRPLAALLPALGVFGVAAFRLMPSMSRIMGSLQSLRYSIPVIDTLHAELEALNATPERERGRALRFEHSLTLQDVSFRYPGANGFALTNVSLTIRRGVSAGIIGGSGAGKTTLVDLLLGLLAPASGHISVDGVDIRGNMRGWQNQIGYVPQAVFLTDDTLRRNVAFGLADADIDDAAIGRAIHAAQLDEFVSGLPERLESIVGERGVKLSGGQRQRIGIARALYHDPAVLVLDEATSSLDSTTEGGVMAAVNALQGNKTVVVVAHRLSTVERCDHVFRLDHGRIVEQGSFDAVVRLASAVNH